MAAMHLESSVDGTVLRPWGAWMLEQASYYTDNYLTLNQNSYGKVWPVFGKECAAHGQANHAFPSRCNVRVARGQANRAFHIRRILRGAQEENRAIHNNRICRQRVGERVVYNIKTN